MIKICFLSGNANSITNHRTQFTFKVNKVLWLVTDSRQNIWQLLHILVSPLTPEEPLVYALADSDWFLWLVSQKGPTKTFQFLWMCSIVWNTWDIFCSSTCSKQQWPNQIPDPHFLDNINFFIHCWKLDFAQIVPKHSWKY